MPMHDWTRVPAGYFHAFHHSWIEELHRALNRGLLPPDYYAAPEQVAGGFGPDIVTLHGHQPDPGGGGLGVAGKPAVGYMVRTRRGLTPRKSAVVVRHVSGDEVVAVVEIVSPGNKASRAALRSFVTKARELLEQQVHLAVVDPFPPGRRDPGGVHRAIWDVVDDADAEPYTPPADRPLTAAAYASGPVVAAFVEPVGVGQLLPELPVFLDFDRWVPAPLEATYQAAWEALPRPWRAAVTAG